MDSPFPEVDLEAPSGLVALMTQVFRDTWVLENSVHRARTLGYLAHIQRSLIETGELERRLNAIEAALRIREDNNEKNKS